MTDTDHPRGRHRDRRPDRLGPFLLAVFALTWGIGALGVLFPDAVRPVFEPLFFLAVYAPTLMAFVFTARYDGARGVRELVRSGLRWRVGWRWFLPAVLVVPAVGLLARWAGGGAAPDAGSLLVLLAAAPLALVTDPGPVGEEFGWRGYALPRLVARHGWRVGALVLGGLWWVWHLPAFLVAGLPQAQLSMPAMALQWFATSVLMAFLWLHTRSVLVAGVLPHLALNLVGTVPAVAADPRWTAPVYAALAVGVLVLGRAPAAAPQPVGSGR